MDVTKNELREFTPKTKAGLPVLLLIILMMVAGTVAFVLGCIIVEDSTLPGVLAIVFGSVVAWVAAPIMMNGLKVIKPNEAIVLTLFGRYYGTIRKEGYYFVNPFTSSVSPPTVNASSTPIIFEQAATSGKTGDPSMKVMKPGKKLSLKAMTLNNERQKVNDKLGNPIIIGIVVIWRVQDTVKAVFNVDNYVEFLSIQCDSALRNIVRMYPYDANDSAHEEEKSLRGSSQEIAASLQQAIQEKVEVAGLEIVEARITHLAYAPEIAAAMLQRQQASAIVDARQLIVDGAVGMVEMALEKLSANQVVELDEERKAAMVSNLLVVLCGNRDAQPVVNSGSLY